MADREMTSQEAIEILGGIRAFYNIFDEYDEPKYAALSKAIFALKAEPTKHGRWEKKGISIKGIEKEFCSECKTWSYGRSKAFCPNCGARMDEVEE